MTFVVAVGSDERPGSVRAQHVLRGSACRAVPFLSYVVCNVLAAEIAKAARHRSLVRTVKLDTFDCLDPRQTLS